MLTALSGVEDKVRAYELGADDFLNKPVNLHELVARVRSLIRIKRLRDELDTSESIIVSMVEALESKDPRTAGHSQRVAADRRPAGARRSASPTSRSSSSPRARSSTTSARSGLPVAPARGAGPPERRSELDEYRRHTVLGERILAPFLSFAAGPGAGPPPPRAARRLRLPGRASRQPSSTSRPRSSPSPTSTTSSPATAARPRRGRRRAARPGGAAARYHRDLVERLLAAGAASLARRRPPSAGTSCCPCPGVDRRRPDPGRLRLADHQRVPAGGS